MVADQEIGSFTPETAFDLYLGRRPFVVDGNSFNGILDDVSLYRRALSGSEISAIYQAGAAGKCLPSGPPLVAYDLSRDFSLAANPNGPWSYGHLIGLNGSFGLLTAPRTFTADDGCQLLFGN